MKKKFFAMIAVMLIIMMILAACAGDTKPPTDSSDGETVVKDTLVVATNAGPADLDPHGTNDQNTNDVRFQVFEALVGVDQEGNIIPRLATKWEWIDPTTIVFTLREGVTFHNGKTFDADDVIFSLTRASEADFTASWLLDVNLADSEILNDYSVKLKLDSPVGALLSRLSNVMIIDKETWETSSEEEMLDKPIGTGPYVFKTWIQGDRLEFEAYEGYWDTIPAFKKLTMRIIPESSSRALEIEAGTVDISLVVQAGDVDILSDDPNVTLISSPSYMITYFGFDCTQEPYNNVLVRKAISHAIDKEAICDIVYVGLGTPANYGRLSEVHWGNNTDVATYPYDPEKAKALLADAGYPDGFEMTLALSEAEQDQIDMSEIIENQLGKVGIKVKLDIMENATFLNMIVDGPFDAFLLNSVGNSADPGEALKSFLDDRPTWSNTTRYFNSELSDLIRRGQQTIDDDEKLAIFNEAQEIVADEVPWVFLVHNRTTFAVRNDIGGMKAYPYRVHMFKEAVPVK